MSDAPEQDFLAYRSTGSPALLERVFAATAPELLRVAAFVLPRDEVEDAVHDTFVIAIGKRTVYAADRPLLPWLLGILANEANARRRARRAALRPQPVRPVPVQDPVAVAAGVEARERFVAALAAMPRDDSALLKLHLEDDLTCREIGERLGRPAGTVRTQVARAMGELRRRLPGSLLALGGFAALDEGMHERLLARLLRAAAPVPVATAAATVVARVSAGARWPLVVGLALLVVGGLAALLRPWEQSPAAATVASVPIAAASADGAPPVVAAASPAASTREVAPLAAAAPAEWSLRGFVRTDNGLPIAGAVVRLRLAEMEAQLAETRTASDGSYRLDLSFWRDRPAVDRARRGLFANVEAKGYCNHPHFGTFPLDAQPTRPLALAFDAALTPYPTVHGRIVGPAGQPLAAEVHVYGVDATRSLLAVGHAEADGGFHVVLVDEGEVEVEARHQAGAPVRARGVVHRGAGTDVGTIVLAPGFVAAGRVELGDGTPLGNWRLGAHGKLATDSYWSVDAETDANGRYSVARPAAIAWQVTVQDVLEQQGLRARATDIAADEQERRIVVDAALVRFRWLDPDGRELLPQRATVRLLAASDDPTKATDRESSLERAALLAPRGSRLRVHASAPGGLVADRTIDVPTTGWRHDVELRFAPVLRAPLLVRVRFADGAVPTAADVQVVSRADHGMVGELEDHGPGWYRFRCPLGPADVQVRGYPSMYDGGDEVRPVDVLAGGSEVEVPIQRRGRIALLVRAAGAVAAPDEFDATVTVAGEEIERFTWTEGDVESTSSELPYGRRAEGLQLLPVGRHELEVTVDGYLPTKVMVDVRADAVTDAEVWLHRKP